MKPSHYNLFVEDNGAIIAANLLSRTVMTFSPAAYEAYCALADSRTCSNTIDDVFLSELKRGLFVLDDDFDELSYLSSRVRQARHDTSELVVVIAPTMGCNFSCHYCFEHHKSNSLLQDTEDAIVETVANRLDGCQSLTVQWFGGEPLKELDTLERLSRRFISLANSRGADYNSDVISNGFYLTEDVAALLKELHVRKVQVTLDGDEEFHDRIRRTTSKEGSYGTILRNVTRASEYIAIQIRVHVAPYNVESVVTLLDDLATHQVAHCISELYFAPIFNYAPQSNDNLFIADNRAFYTSEAFAAVEVSLFTKARQVGLPLPDILDEPFSVCTAVRENAIVIDPTGHLHKCYFDLENVAIAVGDVWQGITEQHRVDEWLDLDIPRDEECANCQFLPVCFGGCSKKWHNGASKSVICNPLRYNIRELLPVVYR